VSLHVLCDCEAQVVLRFKCLGHHFLRPDDFANIYISKGKGLHGRMKMVEVQGVTVVSTLMYPILYTVTLSYAEGEYRKLLHNIDIHLPVYSASHSRIPRS